MAAFDLLDRLKAGLNNTRKGLLRNLDALLIGNRAMNQDLFDELEEILIAADVGARFADDLLEIIKDQVKRKDLNRPELIKGILRDKMLEMLKKNEKPYSMPTGGLYTIMVVGVNGAGKTTTIGKLAWKTRQEGKSVMVAAADTFRAAAIEQLEIWSLRAEVKFFSQKVKADPAAVVYDALQAAKRGGTDVLIVDTAGRLHTKVNLMEEIKKMKRIMAKEIPGAPHETLLVLDATTGQNAVTQAQMFREETGITGIVLTKIDGTSKGGVVIRIASELDLPIRYIGIGEGIDDLRSFDSEQFVDALLES